VRYDHRDWISLGLLGALAALLLLGDLHEPYLWQDEAQTAVIARTVLEAGIPLGSDGRNFFSQEQGAEYAEGYVWRWHTWLSFYAVAASFALLGETTFAARLPFALFGIATVLLGYGVGRRLWESRDAALCVGALLTLSVPFLVLARQCRWYAMAAFFVLLGIHSYSRIAPQERRHSLTLFVTTTLLFHTHYFYAATLLATLLVHSLLLERQRFRRVFVVSAAVTLVNAPWILWFSSIRYGEAYAAHLSSVTATLQIGTHLLQDLFVYFLDPVFLLAPLLLLVLRKSRGEPLFSMASSTRSHLVLLGLFCAISIGALSILSPGAYFRYLAPLVPAALLIAGGMLGALASAPPSASRAAALAIFVLWLGLSPIRDFVHEIRHDFDGPIEGIVRFLEARAEPGDTVAISYGDMPLKFYTQLRVIGGLTGEDLAQAADADWIVLRRHQFTDVDRAVKAALEAHVVPGEYLEYRLRFPDTAFENREDPRLHRFRTAPASHERVVVFGRKRARAKAAPVQATGSPPS
jgi:4-amino-4-deoxy-L-arabinose transferase-like glycosyltransferase